MPEVSVILPTYNRSKTLDRAIRSVLSQTYKDFELIVVDDGSTDNTEALIKNIILLDKRVKYLKLQTNSDVCKARNTGILASSGKYIAFQDSDDEWLPEKLMKQVEIIKTQPEDVGMVYCFMYYITDDSKRISHKIRFLPDETDLYRKGLMYMFRGIGPQSAYSGVRFSTYVVISTKI